MSETTTTLPKEIMSADLPLSVLLFTSAMYQNIPLSEYAQQLGIGALSLRQFIAGQTQRPRGRTLEILASALGMSVEEVRRRTTLRPTSAPPFAEWLKMRMDGRFSRAKLTRETRISDGALRNYLAGQTLPDSDQSMRLSEILNVEPLELAKVLVADHTMRSGGQTVPPPMSASTSDSGIAMMVSPFSGDKSDHNLSPDQQLGHGLHGSNSVLTIDEEHLLNLWRQLHPQGRRATLIYIAGLLTEA